MKKYFIKTISVFYFLLLIVSCDRPECNNTNPIFNKYSPETKIYKDELVKELKKVENSKLTYWMDSYQEINNSKFIYVHIQGDGLCAKIMLTIDSSEIGIEEMLEKKGLTYSGAELENLKFDIKKDNKSTAFIFREVSGIID